ncbi:PAS domain S-box protein [Haloplanus sp. GCM10025708]|uniref:PAS domain S-box protein n=1 Tax=Haloferacaceae TaxID=1644056 RepID=UPI00361E7775
MESADYREIFENVADGLVVHDPDTGEILDVNSRFEDLTGYAREELLGRTVGLVTPDEGPYDHERALHRIRQTRDREPQLFEWEIRARSGDELPVEVHLTVIDVDGDDRVLASVRDISERKSHEAELERYRKFTTDLLDAVDDCIFVLSADGTLKRWNRSLPEVTGYDEDQLDSMTVVDFFPRDAHTSVLETFQDALDTGSAKRELALRTRSGADIPYELLFDSLEDPDGEMVVAAVGRNITNRRAREQQLQVLDRVLRHNLHNDMTVILGRAELIRNRTSGTLAEDADAIIDKSRRLLETVDKEREIVDVILDSSHLRTLDLVDTVLDVATDAREDHPEATIRLNLPDRAPAAVGDHFWRAISELVENAIVHCDCESPTVEIGLDHRDDIAVLRVADEGPPIPDADVDVLTGLGPVDPLYHGSGLGLWLVYWSVTHSRGTVSVETSDDGNVVTVEVPAV